MGTIWSRYLASLVHAPRAPDTTLPHTAPRRSGYSLWERYWASLIRTRLPLRSDGSQIADLQGSAPSPLVPTPSPPRARSSPASRRWLGLVLGTTLGVMAISVAQLIGGISSNHVNISPAAPKGSNHAWTGTKRSSSEPNPLGSGSSAPETPPQPFILVRILYDSGSTIQYVNTSFKCSSSYSRSPTLIYSAPRRPLPEPLSGTFVARATISDNIDSAGTVIAILTFDGGQGVPIVARVSPGETSRISLRVNGTLPLRVNCQVRNLQKSGTR